MYPCRCRQQSDKSPTISPQTTLLHVCASVERQYIGCKIVLAALCPSVAPPHSTHLKVGTFQLGHLFQYNLNGMNAVTVMTSSNHNDILIVKSLCDSHRLCWYFILSVIDVKTQPRSTQTWLRIISSTSRTETSVNMTL